jgi:hypothetical protein
MNERRVTHARRLVLVVAAAAVAGGCAHGSVRLASPGAPAPATVARVRATITETVPAERRAVYEELGGNHVIEQALIESLTEAGKYDPHGDVLAEVRVDGFRLRSTANAAFNGWFAGIDKLEGEVDLKRSDTEPVRYVYTLSGTEDVYFKWSASARFRSLARTLADKLVADLSVPGAGDD